MAVHAPLRLPTGLTPQSALSRAWVIYFAILPLPLFAFGAAIHRAVWVGLDTSRSAHAQRWFLALCAYMIVTVPCALFYRSYRFRAYYAGQPVSPHDYLVGNTVAWVAFASVGLLASLCSYHTHTLAPTLLPAALSLFLYFILPPTGCALTSHYGNRDDPGLYDEPR